jgi:hypothetical protein
MLQTLITLKNPSHLAGFEPMSLGSNVKQANHYTTEVIMAELTAACLLINTQSFMQEGGHTTYCRYYNLVLLIIWIIHILLLALFIIDQN